MIDKGTFVFVRLSQNIIFENKPENHNIYPTISKTAVEIKFAQLLLKIDGLNCKSPPSSKDKCILK